MNAHPDACRHAGAVYQPNPQGFLDAMLAVVWSNPSRSDKEGHEVGALPDAIRVALMPGGFHRTRRTARCGTPIVQNRCIVFKPSREQVLARMGRPACAVL